MLLHPKNMSFVDLSIYPIALDHVLSNYYVICCMIAKCLDRNDGDTYITNMEMNEKYFKCGLQNQLDLYCISRFSINILDLIIKYYISDYFKSKNNKELEALIFSKICTPTLRVLFFRIFPENVFAYIKKFDESNKNFGLDRDIIGFGYNISRKFSNANRLWRLISFNHPQSNGYLFFNEKDDIQNLLSALIEELLRSAKHSVVAINSIVNSWDKFIKNPSGIIDEKLEKYDE